MALPSVKPSPNRRRNKDGSVKKDMTEIHLMGQSGDISPNASFSTANRPSILSSKRTLMNEDTFLPQRFAVAKEEGINMPNDNKEMKVTN